MNEDQMIKYAQQGDLDAFNRLVLEYQSLAYNVAYRLMGDGDSAADITQDAFIAAYQKLDTFRGGSFKAWLMRIVTNTGYDELRRRKRRPVTPLEPEGDDGDTMDSPAWMEDDAESPEDSAIRAELSKAIQRCLQELKQDFRAVVILVDIQGMDYAEVSDMVSSPLGTVKSRLARARGQMQQCLQGFGELLPPEFRFNQEGNS